VNSQTSEACSILKKKHLSIYACDLLNQTKDWRRKPVLNIPVDCKYMEEEVWKQIRRNPKFINTHLRDSFLKVEIEDPGILVIEDNIEAGEYKETLIREYRLNHQQSQQNVFQFYTDGSLGKETDQEKKMGAAWIQSFGPN